MTRLSVLLVPGVFPPDSGGPATFAPDIGQSLVDRGYAVRVVTNGTAPEGFDDRYPFDVVRIRRGESVPSRYARQLWTLIREIRSFDPDVLLANAFDLQAMSAARITGTPATTKVVGDNAWERARRSGLEDDIESFQRGSYGPKVRGLKVLRTLQTRLADRVVTPSEYLRDVVAGWGVPRERTEVIYNAIDLDAPSVERPNREARIVTVGRLVPWKGVDGLLEAFGRADIPGAEFHVVGDGPERETLERKTDRVGVANRTVFHGRVPHERVLELVAGSRVFALNSTYEGLPHVVLEAMACGTPIVASAAGGTPEAVADGQSGILVEQGDADGFASAFETLFGDDEQWEHLRQGGFDRLEERFDHGSMVDAYEDLLGELA